MFLHPSNYRRSNLHWFNVDSTFSTYIQHWFYLQQPAGTFVNEPIRIQCPVYRTDKSHKICWMTSFTDLSWQMQWIRFLWMKNLNIAGLNISLYLYSRMLKMRNHFFFKNAKLPIFTWVLSCEHDAQILNDNVVRFNHY